MSHRKTHYLSLFLLVLSSTASTARAEPNAVVDKQPTRGVSAETNILWPFYPGGIAEFKVLVPVVGVGSQRGELLTGLHSDFMQRQRLDKGKVNILALKFGYRQYLWRGLHAELSANLGWRSEHQRPSTGESHDDFVISTWGLAGYQLALTNRFYVNTRAGVGYIAYRSTGWPGQRDGVFFASDLNLGVHF